MWLPVQHIMYGHLTVEKAQLKEGGYIQHLGHRAPLGSTTAAGAAGAAAAAAYENRRSGKREKNKGYILEQKQDEKGGGEAGKISSNISRRRHLCRQQRCRNRQRLHRRTRHPRWIRVGNRRRKSRTLGWKPLAKAFFLLPPGLSGGYYCTVDDRIFIVCGESVLGGNMHRPCRIMSYIVGTYIDWVHYDG